MDLYLGAPKALLRPMGLGYALAHEMDSEVTIQKYKATNKLILDNGADELGEGLGGEKLAYLTGKLDPYFLILPDVLHKPKKTRLRSLEFLSKMKDAGYKGQFMAVIQDKDKKKAANSILEWSCSAGVNRLGITYDTKIVTNDPSPESWMRRLDFLEWFISEYKQELNNVDFHLLGTLEVNELYRLFHLDRYAEVRKYVASHDTTAPYACPTRFVVDQSGTISFGREKNWKSLNFGKQSFSGGELDTIAWNTACYLAACKVPKQKWTWYMDKVMADMMYAQFENYCV